jgi:hypothetical protein
MANEFDLAGFAQALNVAPTRVDQSQGQMPESMTQKRESDRMAILQVEMEKAKQRLASGDQRAQRDIESLMREMGGKTAVVNQPVAQNQPQGGEFDLAGFGKALLTTQPETVAKPAEKLSAYEIAKQKHNAQIEEAFKKIPSYEALQAFGMGVGGGISKGLGGLQQLVGKGVGLVAPEAGQAISENALKNVRQTEQQMSPYQQARPLTTGAGEIAGAVISPVNKLVPMGSATGLMGLAQGAGQGAVSNILTTPVTDENKAFLTSKLEQAFAGGVGGAAGTALARAPGALAEPFKKSLGDIGEKAVQTLRDAGVPLDIAQATGSSFLQRSKAMLNDNPFTANAEQVFAAQQKSAYNKAIAKTMGEDAAAITPDVIQAAKTRLGQNYDDLASRNKIHFDDELKNSLAEIKDRASNALADTQFSVIDKAIKSIENKAESSGGVIDGTQYKNIKRLLNDIEKQNVPGSHYAGEMKELLLETLSRSAQKSGSTADVQLLKETNRQYGNMKKIEDIVSRDVEGNVSPSLLSNSLATKSKRNALYQEDPQLANLARAGKLILENKTPNSGTVARLAAQAAPAALAGGLYGLYEGDLSGAAKGAAVGFAIPKAMQAAANNPALARYFEQGMQKGPMRSVLQAPQRIGGMLPEYMQKPGAVGGTALRELINQRNSPYKLELTGMANKE